MTVEYRQCQSCTKQTVYRVRPDIAGYSVGSQDVCPGCAVRRRALRESAEEAQGRISSLRLRAVHSSTDDNDRN